MRKSITIVLSTLIFTYANAKVSQEEKDLLQSMVPGTKIIDADKTPIGGLYIALIENDKFLYLHPYSGMLFFGEIMTTKGQNLSNFLTQKLAKENQSQAEMLKAYTGNKEGIEKMKKAAFQVIYNEGNEDYGIYVFTDPDCPFCQKLEKFFSRANVDVRYIFSPMKNLHPQAEIKSKQLISSADHIPEILEQIREKKDLKVKVSDESQEKLESMIDAAKTLKIQGTPMLLILDKKTDTIIDFIRGADIPKIKKYAKEENEK